jgi:hypothetical protein
MREFCLQPLTALFEWISDVGRCWITKMFSVTNVEWVVFFFPNNFVMKPIWWSSIRWFSQIWR